MGPGWNQQTATGTAMSRHAPAGTGTPRDGAIRKPCSPLRACLLVTAIWLLASPSATARAQYGIYFDDHRRGANVAPKYVDHPQVDGVMLRFRWAELEPVRGQHNFDLIERRIEPWVQAGKKAVIGVMWTAPRRDFTPQWVLDQTPVIRFTHSSKGRDIQQAKCWDPVFRRLARGLIDALGARYEGDDRIEAVLVGVGHIGFITAAPNAAGAAAFIEQGWTPALWTDYALAMAAAHRRAFPSKPLILRGSSLLLRMRQPAKAGFHGHLPHFIDVRDEILLQAARKYRTGIGANGLEADPAAFLATGLPDLFARLAAGAERGAYSLELSDDWPIWAPPDLRRGVNRRKDNAHFIACLENAVGGSSGIPLTRVSFMKLLDTDLLCTYPSSPHYQAACAEKLRWFRSRLFRPPAGGS